MANIHILSTDGTELTAAFHVSVPATNNAAGVPWRTVALRNGGGTTVLPDGDGTLGSISAAEKAQIVSGAVVEIVRSAGWARDFPNVPTDGLFPTGAQLDTIAAKVTSDYLAAMQAKYSRYGVTR